MGKSIVKSIYAVLMFCLALFLSDHFTNKGNMDITTEMSEATLPLVSVQLAGDTVNCLHGYVQKMDTSFQCETITPVDKESRSISFLVDTFGNMISGVSFEVRSVDGSRLVEDTKVDDFTVSDDQVRIPVTVKDLLEENTEYSLELALTDAQGRTVYYYTRIMLSENAAHVEDEVEFALDFHSRTFDKERAQEIAKYLESNEEGDNTTYSRVTIHSSFSQITWGSLSVKKETEPEIYVRQINPYVGRVELTYIVSMQTGVGSEYFNVVERYYVRPGSERMYLLDFERTMDSIFQPENEIYTNNKIYLGITGDDIEKMESQDGNILAFVKENRLYSLNLTDNKLALLFGFYDAQHNDARDRYANNDIRIISVDETGNVRFLVYGYMNRGSHEGTVGVTCYYYNSMLNTIEEEIYIPYKGPAGIVAQFVEQFAYVNNTNQLFLILDGTIYQIDLGRKEYEILVENLPYGSYKVSESNRMIVWQEGNNPDACSKLILLNLNSGKQTEIEAGSGKYLKPLGFMNEDLIYGIAYRSDISKDAFGATIFPMYNVRIQNEYGEILKNYEKPGIYVVDAKIEQNQINLTRVKCADGSSAYVSETDDQILNDVAVESEKNTIEVAATQEYEKIVQLAAKSNIKKEKLKYLTPKQVMYEGERVLLIEQKESEEDCYYVYDGFELARVLQKENDAVQLADELSGKVLDQEGRCIWEKSNRVSVNQIMKISEDEVSEERNSVAVCLDTILKYEGVNRNSAQMLAQGKSLLDVLRNGLSGCRILDLSGCSLSSVLYYVSRDIPVMALQNDGNAVLIVGYNELNTVIFNPQSGKISQMGMNDSTAFFEANGNSFITYLPAEQ